MKITRLSVNLNKIALIHNARGRNYPDVVAFARRFMDLGAAGVTLHPRPDQRHARYADAFELKKVCDELGKELNLEGYPTREFLDVVNRCGASISPRFAALMAGYGFDEHGTMRDRAAYSTLQIKVRRTSCSQKNLVKLKLNSRSKKCQNAQT